ncbi:MAG: type I DNA topoisomerase, partial [Lachnospiraceae bacterium]|nr:type I DNA topoisomerase [Lachnospiraceae bacterium]
MAKKLIIVESPAKVKTIKKFLGAGYDVAASGGHVRDLPKSTMGIDTEHDFEPRYITIRGKGDVLADLRRRAKNADKVYLATDPDREGEAIAWHLTFALGIDPAKTYRISFNEITKKAVKEALKEPREIDIDLVNAQQGRRVLDRLVGYSISPILWKKVKKGLSAGRVQSATLRMICDREEAIAAFVPEEYWTIDAELKNDDMRSPLVFHYYGTRGEKTDIPDEKTAQAIAERAEKNDFTIAEIRKGERVKKAPAAFTTSTLQQEASKRLNFSTGKTMRIAQQLYEGVELGKEGVVGIITYLRTDSTRIAAEAQEAAKEYIGEEFGEAYLNSQAQTAAEGRIQDAHEAIRPTDIRRTPSAVREYLNRDQLRLSQLIWKR